MALRYIPNLLTLSRLFLCPFTVALFLSGRYVWGLGLYVLACLTDYFDGRLARKYGVISRLGSILDPICDKLTSFVFFALLMTLGVCPAWFLGLFISVVLLQTIGLLLLNFPAHISRFQIQPLNVGKWNTLVQFFWIGLVFVDIFLRNQFPRNFHYSHTLYLVGYGVLGSIQVIVFLRYFFHHRQALMSDIQRTSPLSP